MTKLLQKLSYFDVRNCLSDPRGPRGLSVARKGPPEARLAWALVEEALCPSDAGWTGHGPAVREPLIPYGDRLIPPPPGEGGRSYRLASLSAYAHLPPSRRPPAFCPVCRERVWMKLGPRNRHHYAHAAPDSACPAATAEGALHLAAKLHLAEVLERLRALRIARLCNRSPNDLSLPCRASELSEWVADWDEVRVEHAIPSIRADLMLLASGRPIGAIEVCASHAVDEGKAARYRDLGVPWVEVPAERITDLWRPLWEGDSPLPVLADSQGAPWRCPRHGRLFAAWTDHQSNGVHRLAGRFVHVYRTDGGLSASLLRAERIPVAAYERREDGRCAEAWLVREDTDARLGQPVCTPDRDGAMRTLHRAFADWVRWTRESRGAVVDSPMRWLPADAMPTRDLDTLFPQRARWDPHTVRFILPPNAPSLSWPSAAEDAGMESLTGTMECFWTALPERDRPAMSHALVGRLWATLQVERWSDEEGGRSRGLLYLYRHEGGAWREWGRLPFVLERAPDFDWDAAFLSLVRGLAREHAADATPDIVPLSF
jgi:hypothetical protein